ncbi:MAG: indole-3-glycerol phosphate synthase TrpC [Deltaproteobacteria bacterium]|nr:indole-3-glycerol phosphate synthase TrpC [Deltaproteobacteria bacterium]
MNKVLEKIIDYKKLELESQKRKVTLKDLRFQVEDTSPARDFLNALRCPGIRVIAEIKKASPSAGLIRPDFDPVAIAQSYEQNGAAALSILTDEHFFQGSLKDLEKVKKVVPLPLLRKDFTLDAYQIYEARAAGADAVLLIVRILEPAQIKDYLDLATELGMSALLEVHDEEDLKKTKPLVAKIIGINNRDLDTLKIDLETSVKLSKNIPQGTASQGTLIVSESGISSSSDVQKLQRVGINTFLIGESLLRAKDSGKALKEILDQQG